MVNTSEFVYREALKVLEKDFEDYACRQQDFLGDELKWNKVLAMIPSEGLFLSFNCRQGGFCSHLIYWKHLYKSHIMEVMDVPFDSLKWLIIARGRHVPFISVCQCL